MLGRSFNTVTPIAIELADKGLILQARPSSILAELCQLAKPLDFQFENTVGDKQPPESVVGAFGMMLDLSTQGQDEKNIPWCSAFDNTVETLSGLIKAQTSYIRNVVVPNVQDFVHDAGIMLQEAGASNPTADLELVRATVPEFATEAAFFSQLDAFNLRKPVAPTSYSLSFPFAVAPANFLEVASTSNGRIDAMVGEWAAKTQDMNWLEKVWHTFFASQSLMNGTYKGTYLSDNDMVSPDIYVRLNVALAYYLIANYYYNHLPDIVTNESVDSIKTRLYEHMSYAGSTVCECLQRIESNNKNDMLVVYADTFHKKITVADEIYDRWLAAGGSVELVFGILVGNKPYFSISQIEENKAELENIWKHFTRVQAEMVEIKKDDVLRTNYINLLGVMMTPDRMDENEGAYHLKNPGFAMMVIKNAEAYLHTLSKDKLCDVTTIAKELIAGGKYGFTHAKMFLEEIEAVGVECPNAVPEEAAMMAVMNYVVDYLHLQIAVAQV